MGGKSEEGEGEAVDCTDYRAMQAAREVFQTQGFPYLCTHVDIIPSNDSCIGHHRSHVKPGSTFLTTERQRDQSG